MDGDIITSWLQQYAPVWVPALLAGVAPAIIAFFKGRSVMGWYLYGVACTVVAWPLIALPTVHALLVRPRVASPQKVSLEQRRAQALALFRSVQSHPSWIAEFSRKAPTGIDRHRYVYDHLRGGDTVELVRDRAKRRDHHAVAYYHRGVHLGYIPEQHLWVADAMDDGHRVIAVVEQIKVGLLLRRRAKFVGTRIAVLD